MSAAATECKPWTLSAILPENRVKNKELKRKFDGDFSELRKIINSWELIQGCPSDEFDDLNHRLLSQLYKDADYEKINGILQSELIINYGLFQNEFDSDEFIKDISNWWKSKYD